MSYTPSSTLARTSRMLRTLPQRRIRQRTERGPIDCLGTRIMRRISSRTFGQKLRPTRLLLAIKRNFLHCPHATFLQSERQRHLLIHRRGARDLVRGLSESVAKAAAREVFSTEYSQEVNQCTQKTFQHSSQFHCRGWGKAKLSLCFCWRV